MTPLAAFAPPLPAIRFVTGTKRSRLFLGTPSSSSVVANISHPLPVCRCHYVVCRGLSGDVHTPAIFVSAHDWRRSFRTTAVAGGRAHHRCHFASTRRPERPTNAGDATQRNWEVSQGSGGWPGPWLSKGQCTFPSVLVTQHLIVARRTAGAQELRLATRSPH